MYKQTQQHITFQRGMHYKHKEGLELWWRLVETTLHTSMAQITTGSSTMKVIIPSPTEQLKILVFHPGGRGRGTKIIKLEKRSQFFSRAVLNCDRATVHDTLSINYNNIIMTPLLCIIDASFCGEDERHDESVQTQHFCEDEN